MASSAAPCPTAGSAPLDQRPRPRSQAAGCNRARGEERAREAGLISAGNSAQSHRRVGGPGRHRPVSARRPPGGPRRAGIGDLTQPVGQRQERPRRRACAAVRLLRRPSGASRAMVRVTADGRAARGAQNRSAMASTTMPASSGSRPSVRSSTGRRAGRRSRAGRGRARRARRGPRDSVGVRDAARDGSRRMCRSCWASLTGRRSKPRSPHRACDQALSRSVARSTTAGGTGDNRGQ